MFISLSAGFVLALACIATIACFLFNLFWALTFVDISQAKTEERKVELKKGQNFVGVVARIAAFVSLWLFLWLQAAYYESKSEYRRLEVQTGKYADGRDYDYVVHRGFSENLNEKFKRDFKEGEEIYEVWRPSTLGIYWSKALQLEKPEGTEIE